MLQTVSTRCKPKFRTGQLITKRFRGKTNTKPKRSSPPWSTSRLHPPRTPNATLARLPRPPDIAFLLPSLSSATNAPPVGLNEEKCHAYFQTGVESWSKENRTTLRFARFGYSAKDILPFLNAYVSVAQSGFFSSPETFAKYQLMRFTRCGGPSAQSPEKAHLRLADAEITYSNIFFSWVNDFGNSGKILDELVGTGKAKQDTLDMLRHLALVSQRRPAEDFPWARKIQRKFIMHVGPTNSGKTHHALRALAAAKTGVYAGPLRLLAHEIWERLNLGQIVPLGVELPPPGVTPTPSLSPSEQTIPDNSDIAPAAKINSNPQYARATNMLTGEEHKVVSEDASLLSCTVEMASTRASYDVGVIDEIQMIGDPQRGFAWTDAVLGMCAREIHLCGEESAVSVIQQLLKETGDELEIRRYERLTPLNVEQNSLGGSYKNIRKGDCVVAFSRARIFEIKEEIERKSGMRCAVVYGKLPPEIRSEQAALFNDPDSGFDVIIGSDAIGMGLNLKIRRIIFDQIAKPSGDDRVLPLSISQIKQIAGRAGRYGHTLPGEIPGGFTTTLHEKDLPQLVSALSHPSTPALTNAYISSSFDSFLAIASALVPASTQENNPIKIDMETVQMAHMYTSLPTSSVYKYIMIPRLAEICTWIDRKTRNVFTWGDKMMLLACPIGWRDPVVLDAAEEMVKMHRDNMCVFVEKMECIVGSSALGKGKKGVRKGLRWALEEMERKMDQAEQISASTAVVIANANSPTLNSYLPNTRSTPSKPSRVPTPPTVTVEQGLLEELEGLHKILVLYMWQHLRNAVIYPDREAAEGMKHRVEIALDWGLQEVGRGKVKKHLLDEVKDWKTQTKGSQKRNDDEEYWDELDDEWEQQKKERDWEWVRRWKKSVENKKEQREAAASRNKRGKMSKAYKPTAYSIHDKRYGDDYYDDHNDDGAKQDDHEKEYQQAWVNKLVSKPGQYYPSSVSAAVARWEKKDRFTVGAGVGSVDGAKEVTQWTQAPDLSTLLRKYTSSASSNSTLRK